MPVLGAVALQGMKERRQQGAQILLDRLQHLGGQERHTVLEQVEDAAQLAQLAEGFRWCLLQCQLLAQRKQRQVRCPLTRGAQQGNHGLQTLGVAAGIFGSQQDRCQTMLGAGNQLPLGQLSGGQHRQTALFEGGDQLAKAHPRQAAGP